MVLENVFIVGGEEHVKQISIKEDLITHVDTNKKESSMLTISFSQEVIAFPGLLNSHDHLTLNTHSLYKNKVYKDYVEWASDNFEVIIKEINNIPVHLRYEWGILKNVIHGFTTIAQHDSFLKNHHSEIADVITTVRVIHSLHYDKKWKLKALLPESQKKMIHLAEGTSELARNEPKEFLRWNLRSKKSIAIHGVNLDVNEAKKMGGLVWCPNSNIYLYGKTATIKRLIEVTPILFGTDSTVSADWDNLKHLKQARSLGYLTDEELFASLTNTPVNVLNLKNKGSIQAGKIADIVIAKKRKSNLYEAFYSLNSDDILLIVKSGKIVYFDEELKEVLKGEIDMNSFERLQIEESVKYIKYKVKDLVEGIKRYYPKFSYADKFKIL